MTTELVRSLHPYQSVIIPLFHSHADYSLAGPETIYQKILPRCMMIYWLPAEHNAKWFPELWKYYGRNENVVLRKSVDFFLKHGIPPFFLEPDTQEDAAKRK